MGDQKFGYIWVLVFTGFNFLARVAADLEMKGPLN